ncbi:MAG: hypothetical protein ACLFV6_11815, partial [Spirulinaceae cyanobacterium]
MTVILRRRKIEPFGRFLSVDAKGYIVNDCGLNLIRDRWLDLVLAWQEGCIAALNSNLISLYLRGSIPRGLAVENLSDLDGIAIVRSEISSEQQLALESLQQELRSRFPFCTKIETQILSPEILSPASDWGIFLKTQGLNLYGVDFNPQLPPVSLGKHLISTAFQLEEDITQTCQDIRQFRYSRDRLRHKCAWLSRRLVRSGFELVMDREQAYTRDLYPCYLAFSRHFPEQERQMRRCLALSLNPSIYYNALLVFWQDFGGWLVEQI